MLEVSVPCQGCGEPLRFGDHRCRKCSEWPTRSVREALHARLSAASQDYRELQDQISSARTVLLVVALVHFSVGTLAWLQAARSPFPAPELEASMRALLLTDLALGGLFSALWWLGRTFPAASVIAGTGVWLLVQTVLFTWSSPLSLFAGAWVKAVVFILLLRGVVAGVKTQRYLARLKAPSAS